MKRQSSLGLRHRPRQSSRLIHRYILRSWEGGGVGAMTSNEETGTTSYETWFDLTWKGGHRSTMKEVGIQQWKDGKIQEEKFYYHAPGE